MSHFKKILLSSCFIIISISLLFIFLYQSDQRTFTRISQKLFTQELVANTLNMHYTVAYPENYEIEYVPKLSVYSPEKASQNASELENLLTDLENISPGRLTDTDAYTYQLLLSYLYNQRIGNQLHLYEEPFSPSSGVQCGLPILLADYTFRTAKDVEDYLSILSQIDDFLAGLILLEQEKAAAGLFMSDAAADKVIEQCDNIMNINELQSNTHFLQTTFEERVIALEQDGVISSMQKKDYIAENSRLLTTVVQPAYLRTGDDLFLLKGSGGNDMGLYYYPEGQEYYQYLLKNATGSHRDIDEIKKLLYQDFQDNYDKLITLVHENGQLSDKLEHGMTALPVTDPVEILNSLQHSMDDDYPPFPLEHENMVSSCIVKYVSPSMEPYSSPAYYLTPPIDCFTENTIYINQKNNPDNLTLYTTLAHEGYPGHLYQTVYNLLHMQETNGNLLRHILHYGGYVEGWALYVEMNSYEFAKSLVADTSPDSAFLYEYYRLNRSLQLCLYSLLDIAIHYEGADQAQVQKILATIGIENESLTRSIYEYIVEEPTNYLKYYLGYLEILELKKEAQLLMGTDYSDLTFHQFFLDAGPSDFTNLGMKLRSTWG